MIKALLSNYFKMFWVPETSVSTWVTKTNILLLCCGFWILGIVPSILIPWLTVYNAYIVGYLSVGALWVHQLAGYFLIGLSAGSVVSRWRGVVKTTLVRLSTVGLRATFVAIYLDICTWWEGEWFGWVLDNVSLMAGLLTVFRNVKYFLRKYAKDPELHTEGVVKQVWSMLSIILVPVALLVGRKSFTRTLSFIGFCDMFARICDNNDGLDFTPMRFVAPTEVDDGLGVETSKMVASMLDGAQNSRAGIGYRSDGEVAVRLVHQAGVEICDPEVSKMKAWLRSSFETASVQYNAHRKRILAGIFLMVVVLAFVVWRSEVRRVAGVKEALEKRIRKSRNSNKPKRRQRRREFYLAGMELDYRGNIKFSIGDANLIIDWGSPTALSELDSFVYKQSHNMDRDEEWEEPEIYWSANGKTGNVYMKECSTSFPPGVDAFPNVVVENKPLNCTQPLDKAAEMDRRVADLQEKVRLLLLNAVAPVSVPKPVPVPVVGDKKVQKARKRKQNLPPVVPLPPIPVKKESATINSEVTLPAIYDVEYAGVQLHGVPVRNYVVVPGHLFRDDCKVDVSKLKVLDSANIPQCVRAVIRSTDVGLCSDIAALVLDSKAKSVQLAKPKLGAGVVMPKGKNSVAGGVISDVNMRLAKPKSGVNIEYNISTKAGDCGFPVMQHSLEDTGMVAMHVMGGNGANYGLSAVSIEEFLDAIPRSKNS